MQVLQQEVYIPQNHKLNINIPENIPKGKANIVVAFESIASKRQEIDLTKTDIIKSTETVAQEINKISFDYIKKDPMKHLISISIKDEIEDLSGVKPYQHISDSAGYVHDLRRKRR